MSGTKQPEWAPRLTVALRDAQARASEVAAVTPDGGTCNFDSVILRMPRGTRAVAVKAAAAAAGVSVTRTSWCGPGYFVGITTGGHGTRNTRAVEAAAKVLEAAGFRVSMYYQMD